MKSKDIAAFLILGVVMVVAGIVLINEFGSSSKTRTAEIEVVAPIDPTFDSAARQILLNQDATRPVQTFANPVDLNEGLGNPAPFQTDR